jgi:hypothetical protein
MKRIFVFLSTILMFGAASLALNGQTVVGNFIATSFSSGSVLPSTCYGSSVFTLTTTWLPYYCNGGVYVAFGTGAPATTAANLTNGSVGAQPYQTAASTTAFVYPATDLQMLTLDLNRTDSYTEDGTIERPYKNLPTLVIPSTGLASIFASPNASYSTSTATTLPAIPLTIYGNNSTWTFSGGLTVNSLPTTIYDLNTVGNTTYSTCGSTIRSERHGGSYSGGNITLGAGCYTHFYGVNLSGNSYNLTANGLLYGEALTGSMGIKSEGSSAVLALYNPNITKTSGYNIDMTSGGQLLFNGGILNTVAGTANVYLPVANTSSTAHLISGLITGTGNGVNCVNGTTTYVVYGFNLAPITNCTLVPGYQGSTNFLGPVTANSVTSSTATQLTVQSGTTGAATFDSGTTGAVNIATGAGSKVATLGNSSNSSTQILGSYVYIGSGQTSGSINIGGSAAATGGVNIAPGTGAQTVSIATTATGVKTVNVGNTVSGSKVNIAGEIDGVAAGAGYVGEVLSSCIVRGSGTALTSASTINFLTLSLTAGDWDVMGNVNLVGAALTASNGNFANSITTTSATVSSDGSEVLAPTLTMTTWTGYNSVVLPRKVVNVSATTSTYLVVNFQGTITSGTGTLWGCMTARRVH